MTKTFLSFLSRIQSSRLGRTVRGAQRTYLSVGGNLEQARAAAKDYNPSQDTRDAACGVALWFSAPPATPLVRLSPHVFEPEPEHKPKQRGFAMRGSSPRPVDTKKATWFKRFPTPALSFMVCGGVTSKARKRLPH